MALPPIPRPLKRSASMASLPTPPRSRRRLAGGKSNPSTSVDSTSSPVTPIPRPLKRSDSTASLPTPPRSHRRLAGGKSNAPTTVGSTSSPPVTPKTRSSTRRALRDSPDNPFLVTPENHVDDTPSPSESSANPSPHGPFQERPTIAYVLYVFLPFFNIYICINDLFSRGVRRECKNPLYNHAQDRPFSPPPESKLAIDHPDYSPSIHCIPKRLFPGAHSKRKKPKTASKRDSLSRKRARERSPSLSTDEGDVGEIRPLKLDFGREKRAGGPTSDQEL